MRKLIPVGLIVAVLTVILIPALVGGMPSDPPPPPPPPDYDTESFYHEESGTSIGGYIRAYDTYCRHIYLSVSARALNTNYPITRVNLVIAMWDEDYPNKLFYKPYLREDDIEAGDGYWNFSLSLNEEDCSSLYPDKGFVYIAYWKAGQQLPTYYPVYLIEFFSYKAPEIGLSPIYGPLYNLQDMYRIALDQA